MSNKITKELINEILTLSKESDNELHEKIETMLDFYKSEKKQNKKIIKQNEYFLKQWDKRNIIAHEREVKKDEMLEQQSKMAAMGEMMDAVAHQWKQPLNSLSIMTDILISDFNDGLVDKRYIEELTQTTQNQINHMITTLSEFRTFFRPVTNSNTNFQIQECINSVQILMKDELIIHNIILYINIEDGLRINGKENEFKHLFLNLINNSIDAFEEKKKSLSRHIYIRAYQEKDKIYIEFEDNAGGILEHIIDNIFKPNITTKEDGKGTGIGLYMSYQIVEKNNGKINVHNSNMGAFFTITLQQTTT